MNLYDDLSTKVKAAGLTFKAVCEEAGVSSGTPSHWAAGRTAPNQSTYDRMIQAVRRLVSKRQSEMQKAGVA